SGSAILGKESQFDHLERGLPAIGFLIPDRRAHALGVVLAGRADVTPRDTDDLVTLERRGESESVARGVAQKHSLKPFVVRGLVAEDGVVYAVDLGRPAAHFGLREVSKLHELHATAPQRRR